MPEIHIISFSELDSFRQCPLKHELQYKERWTPSEPAISLTRGKLWHAMMEAHYHKVRIGKDLESPSPDIIERAQTAAYTTLSDVEDEEMLDLLIWMYQGYIQQYGDEPEWLNIETIEKDLIVPLPTPSGQKSPTYKLKMKLDLLAIDDRARVWLWDHKTAKNLPRSKDIDLDDQLGLYTYGCAEMGIKVFGQLHNIARTQRNKGDMLLDERFVRMSTVRSMPELQMIGIEALRCAKRAYNIKSGEADRVMDPERCGWRCPFTEACLWGRKAGPYAMRQFLRDTGFTQDYTRH